MTKNIFIKTYGCSFNQLDSQIMASKLIQHNHNIIQNDKSADIIIINSCTVKNSSEAKLFNDINKYTKQNKKIIVAGCIPQAQPSYIKTKLKPYSVIGINDLYKITQIVDAITKQETLQILSPLQTKQTSIAQREKKEKLRLLTNHNKFISNIAIIPINEGCLNKCTFCKTKDARGNLFSYSIENIKQSMQNAINAGAKEIYLTSQDTACYGFDINTNLPTLLKELLKIKGDYKIRIGMGNPNHFVKIIDDILDLMKTDNRIYKFLHIPIQSGSNRILKEMRRGYNVCDYDTIVQKIRKSDTKITLANDIIVAYPTETKEEFEETLNSLKKSKTNVLNFSRFWLRPSTPCEKIYSQKDFIDGLESKNRAKKLKEEFEKIALKNNKKWINWQGEVIVTEIGKKGTSTMIARNNYYKPIVIENSYKKVKIGEIVQIKIEDVTWFDFRAKLIE